jgi:hypothetical protein
VAAPTRNHHRTARGSFTGGTARAASPTGSDASAAASSVTSPTLQELLSESGKVFGTPAAVADLDVADDNAEGGSDDDDADEVIEAAEAAPLTTSTAQRWSPQQPGRAPIPREAYL